MPRPVPDKSAIRALASPESFERGRRYRDAVSDIAVRGDDVTAAVQGSEPSPYRVTVRLDGSRVAEARCTCPYDWGGACKHVVATLLRLADDPDAAVERPTLRTLLSGLDRDALVDLIAKRADSDHDLAGWLEAELATTVRAGSGTRVDPEPVAARARAVLAERYRRADYWDGYRPHGNPEALRDLVAKATPFLEKGDGRNALSVLEAVTDSFVDEWLEYAADSDEEMYELFADLGAMMAEAALMGDLTEAERSYYVTTLEDWHGSLSDYGAGGWFAVAAHAMRSGWDDPGLQAVLAGKGGAWPPGGRSTADGRAARTVDASEDDAWDDNAWDDDDEDLEEDWDEPGDDEDDPERFLLDVRLRVLDGTGQSEAYLNLARAAGAHVRVATMLAKLGRTDEAVAVAKGSFVRPDQSLELAQALLRMDERDAALAVAEAGLHHLKPARGQDAWHPGHSSSLARWLREQAEAAGRSALALKAARAAFATTLSLDDYRALQPLAGAAWDAVRRDSLARLIDAKHAPDRVEILLSEGMVDEAVASVGEARDHATSSATLLKLLDAAHARHPDWVIRIAERRAAEIMDRGSAGLYEEAAAWLKRAALAYDDAGRIDAWSDRIEGLIEKHRRKYKLRPLLEALRFDR